MKSAKDLSYPFMKTFRVKSKMNVLNIKQNALKWTT